MCVRLGEMKKRLILDRNERQDKRTTTTIASTHPHPQTPTSAPASDARRTGTSAEGGRRRTRRASAGGSRAKTRNSRTMPALSPGERQSQALFDFNHGTM